MVFTDENVLSENTNINVEVVSSADNSTNVYIARESFNDSTNINITRNNFLVSQSRKFQVRANVDLLDKTFFNSYCKRIFNNLESFYNSYVKNSKNSNLSTALSILQNLHDTERDLEFYVTAISKIFIIKKIHLTEIHNSG
uniref:Uncharacterized protein n=1 Tax=Strongyloides stercoralis TaxID=6248 RepID=A0A0K0EC66_STRER